LLAIFGTLTHIAEQIIDVKKQKLLPTQTDLNPNYKFVNNLFVRKIEENTCLQKECERHNALWNNDLDMLFVRKVYYELTNAPVFASYMRHDGQSFEEDKAFILEMVEKFLLQNEMICSYFGEKKLHWLHDYNDTILLVYNVLKTFTPNQRPEKPLPPLFKTDADGFSDDRQFMLDLFRKTIEHDEEYTQIVSQKLLNWEMDRVACMDFILLKMAICELCEFPSIPPRVTLNEYIEISKYYSTPKSKYFINGMLDGILADLKAENKINKRGRGLMG
jgi:N utilization substance protein B